MGGVFRCAISICLGAMSATQLILEQENQHYGAAVTAAVEGSKVASRDAYDGNLLLQISPESLIFPVTLVTSLAASFIPNAQARLTTVIFAIILVIFVVWFYRSPPIDKSGYAALMPLDCVSPATGVVLRVDRLSMDEVRKDYGAMVSFVQGQLDAAPGAGGATRICIGMLPYDVHVQAMPMAGVINQIVYKKGTFEPIFGGSWLGLGHNKTDANERVILECLSQKAPQTARSFTFYVVQIAGLMTRNIVTFDNVGMGRTLERGDKYGMIKFGSRVDLIVPDVYDVQVKEGQSVNVGETVVAKYREVL